MYFAWFAPCRLLVWNAGELMDEAESTKGCLRSRICISKAATYVFLCVCAIEADILNWQRFRKYNRKTQILHVDQLSRHLPRHRHQRRTSTTTPTTTRIRNRNRIRNTFKNASQGCCCCCYKPHVAPSADEEADSVYNIFAVVSNSSCAKNRSMTKPKNQIKFEQMFSAAAPPKKK